MGNFLNLVYDELGEDIIPNGKKYYPNRNFWNIENEIKHYINSYPNNVEDQIQIKRFTLEDINENGNFNYFICNGGINLDEIIKEGHILNKKIVNCLKQYKNFRIIFFSHHEPDSVNGFIKLNNFLIENEINQNQIFVVNNNFKLLDYVKKFNSNIQVHPIPYLAITMSTILLQKNSEVVYNTDKKEKLFMCFNRGPKLHRCSLLLFMMKHNILKDTNWSFIPNNSFNYDKENYEELFESVDFNQYVSELDTLNNIKLKVSDHEINELSFDVDNNITVVNEKYRHLLTPPDIPNNYNNSYINIITESNFFDSLDVIHVTEKSIKPFFHYQLPIIVATQGHLKTLRENFEFDFFDDVINHDYDGEPNQKRRFKMICNEIKRLNENKESIVEFYEKNYDRLENNRQKVIKIINKHVNDYTFFKNLI